MRQNYNNHGVEQYYQLLSSSYRNPHFEGVRISLFKVFSRLYHQATSTDEDWGFLDLAAGSGEATSVFLEWYSSCQNEARYRKLETISIPKDARGAKMLATDPYTFPAFQKLHGSLPFQALSFSQIEMIEGKYTICVCSFAMHLIENPSELWSCLDQLSRKCQWLVILSPHKKPEIKNTIWGWSRYDVEQMSEDYSDSKELVIERVRTRVYRSCNYGNME